MSGALLLLDANGWTWIAVIVLLAIGGFFFLDKLIRKGIYEEGRAGSCIMGRAGSALSELQTLVQPAQKNVAEQKERKRAEHDDAGDDPDPAK